MRVHNGRKPVRVPARPSLRLELLEDRTLLSNNLPAILLLDPAGSGALNVVGNGNISVAGGSAVVNSTSPQGAKASGNAAAGAGDWFFSGSPGYAVTGHATFQGTIHSGAAPTEDPLAGLPVPTLPATTFGAVSVSGTTTRTLSPGTYVGGINVSGNALVTLLPGIYYLKGGGLTVSGNSHLTGDGVMIYNEPHAAGDAVSFSGSSTVRLTPPTSGTYQNVTIFQDRA